MTGFLKLSLFAAVCALSLCVATESVINNGILAFPTAMHGFVVGGTLMIYNAFFLFDLVFAADHNRQLSLIQRGQIGVFGVGVLLATVSFLRLPGIVQWAGLSLCIPAVLYTVPLLPAHWLGVRQLRDWGMVKIVTLTMVWVGVTSVLPMLWWQQSPDNYPFELIKRTLFMFTLCIAFDIRDRHRDVSLRSQTLPNRLGVTRTFRLMFCSLSGFALSSLVQYLRLGEAIPFIADLLTTALAIPVLWRVKRQPSDAYYLLAVDGLMIVNGGLVLLLANA